MIATDPDVLINGLLVALTAIAKNDDTNLQFTHKEVRCMARGAMLVIDQLPLPSAFHDEIAFLIECMGAYGLVHSDRSQFAERAFKRLEKLQMEREWLKKNSDGEF